MTRKDNYWINTDSRHFLNREYLYKGETPESRIRDIAETAEAYLVAGDPTQVGFADKFIRYMERGYYSLATPIWTNYGRTRGLPISCYGCRIADTTDSILYKNAEVGMMTKLGGGTSGYFGDIRGRGTPISGGGESNGVMPFLEQYNLTMSVVSQGSVRRGAFAAYLPVDHPDIEEFLEIRGEGNSIQDLSFGVCVSDEWMQDMIEKKPRNLKIWSLVLKKRAETGYPYIFFTGNANKQKPQVYKDNNIDITHTNLCSEIMLGDTYDESFVCDLSSMNADMWDEWKNTDAVQLLTLFLDTVMTEFINKTEGVRLMDDARRFAIRQRALGIGMLGWHSYLQSKMIAFESMEAKLENVAMWKHIKTEAEQASRELARVWGEPELLVGYGMRNVTLLACAPTTSSSFILGQVSPSVEPLNSNYFVKALAKGNYTWRNPYLQVLLEQKEQDTDETWMSILKRGGSVQHLKFLDQHEKDVFKTFGEITQKEIIIQAAQRQKYIDQGQSINLMIGPHIAPKEINQLMIFAWEQGLKSLYYQRSTNPSQELARKLNTCVSCEA